MLAFRPLSILYKDIQNTWGVQSTTNKPGKSSAILRKAKKAGLEAEALAAGVGTGKRIPFSANEWWTRQMRIWNGTPGSLDKAIYRFGDWVADRAVARVWNNTVGRLAPDRKISHERRLGGYKDATRGFIRGWMYLNYVGALGFSPGAALKNLTQNVPTIAEIGLPNWLWGAKSLMRQRTGDGLPEFTKLIEELGVYEGSFVKSMNTDLERVIDDTAFRALGNLSESAFVMFSGSEWILRGIAGMGGYRKMYKSLEAQGVSKKQAHLGALSWGREMVRRTQFDYKRMLGPQAFSSDTMKAVAQFARFQLGMTDYLQLVIRRGLGSKEAAATMPLMPGQSGLTSMLIAAAGPYILGAALWNTLGVAMPDTESLGGPVPSAVQYPLALGAQYIGEAIGGPAGGLKARKILRKGGLSTAYSSNIFDALGASLGPGVGQTISLGHAIFAKDPADRERALREFVPEGDGFWQQISKGPLPYPIALRRIARFMEEGKTGSVRSRSGNRLFPGGRRELGLEERALRLLGLQVRDLNEEMDLLSDREYFRQHWNHARKTLRETGMAALDNGEDPGEVVAGIVAAMGEIEDDFFVSFSGKEVTAEIKHIFKRAHERARTTVREESDRDMPFRLVRDKDVLDLLGGR
jgi:hypothetical protein